MVALYQQKKLKELKEQWMLVYLGRSLKHHLKQLAIGLHGTLIERFMLNRKLLDATGNVTMTVDPKCVYLIKDLEQVQRDKKGGIDKSQIELTHSLDACSYAISYKFPVISRASTTMEW